MVATQNRIPKRTRVRISKSGQMTLPVNIREKLGVAVGEHVDIVQEPSGKITIESSAPLSIEEFAGSVGPPPDGKTLTQYLSETDRTPFVRTIYEGKRQHDDRD